MLTIKIEEDYKNALDFYLKATKKDMDEVSSDIKTVAKQIQREDEDRESNSVSVGVVVGTKIR